MNPQKETSKGNKILGEQGYYFLLNKLKVQSVARAPNTNILKNFLIYFEFSTIFYKKNNVIYILCPFY